MKKIINILLLITLTIGANSCAGYKPIFNSSNLNFKIVKHEIIGDKILGKKIYNKLNYLSKSGTNTNKYDLIINVIKNKDSDVKNASGEVLYYKINLKTNIVIKDLDLNEEILNEKFSYSEALKVKDQYSETGKAENKIIKDLINKTYEDLIIKLSAQIRQEWSIKATK